MPWCDLGGFDLAVARCIMQRRPSFISGSINICPFTHQNLPRARFCIWKGNEMDNLGDFEVSFACGRVKRRPSGCVSDFCSRATLQENLSGKTCFEVSIVAFLAHTLTISR